MFLIRLKKHILKSFRSIIFQLKYFSVFFSKTILSHNDFGARLEPLLMY